MTDPYESMRERYQQTVIAGLHDDDCEQRPHDGYFLCHCAKRERIARGITTPPMLYIAYPTCGECRRQVDSDGDGFTCERCHARWPYSFEDGERGEFTDDYGELDPDRWVASRTRA